jgi:hypothetical protein
MEKLKLVLKKVLSEGASQVSLRIGDQVKIIVKHGQVIALPEFGAVDLPWIEGLYKALFPREGLALKSEQLVRSQFNIVNVGKVNAIADPRGVNKTLHLFFPPSGDMASDNFWISLSTPKNPLSPPPPPQTSTVLSGGPGPKTVSDAIRVDKSTAGTPAPTPPSSNEAATQMWQVVDKSPSSGNTSTSAGWATTTSLSRSTKMASSSSFVTRIW